MINFKNTYSKLPSKFFERVNPATFKNPSLISFNYDLAQDLGILAKDKSEHELALIFSGQQILPGSEPIATAYAAHQFGHFVPQLGDGRAHLLGEVNGFDIQLKGSGETSFSRRGDGRSALGAVIREYLVSEAMFFLGISTTRALSAVLTGDKVQRQSLEPGGILTRVGPGHIRVGTFQYFSYRSDREALELLMNYSINRYYPQLKSIEDLSLRTLAFIQSVGEVQAKLIASWMGVGFIHGVMNTDNYTVGGFTIDYGPCAFMDEYSENKVFSSIDRNKRYAYNKQISIGQWNLLRLADSLLPLIDKNTKNAIIKVEKVIPAIMEKFESEYFTVMCSKLGIKDTVESDKLLVNNFLSYLDEEELDFTMAFRNLTQLFDGDSSYYPNTSSFKVFIKDWRSREVDVSNLNKVNPILIPRNHQVELAIVHANKGDYTLFNELKEVSKAPFSENLRGSPYIIPPRKDQRVAFTFCGT